MPHSGGIFALQAFNERDKFILGAYSSVPSIVERGNYPAKVEAMIAMLQEAGAITGEVSVDDVFAPGFTGQ